MLSFQHFGILILIWSYEASCSTRVKESSLAFGEEEISIQSSKYVRIEGIRVEQIRTEAFAEEDIFLIIGFTTIEKSNGKSGHPCLMSQHLE